MPRPKKPQPESPLALLTKKLSAEEFMVTSEVLDKDGQRVDVPATAADARKRQQLLVAKLDVLLGEQFKAYRDKDVTITPKELEEVVTVVEHMGKVRDACYADEPGILPAKPSAATPKGDALQAVARGMMEGALNAAGTKSITELGRKTATNVTPPADATND